MFDESAMLDPAGPLIVSEMLGRIGSFGGGSVSEISMVDERANRLRRRAGDFDFTSAQTNSAARESNRNLAELSRMLYRVRGESQNLCTISSVAFR